MLWSGAFVDPLTIPIEPVPGQFRVLDRWPPQPHAGIGLGEQQTALDGASQRLLCSEWGQGHGTAGPRDLDAALPPDRLIRLQPHPELLGDDRPEQVVSTALLGQADSDERPKHLGSSLERKGKNPQTIRIPTAKRPFSRPGRVEPEQVGAEPIEARSDMLVRPILGRN